MTRLIFPEGDATAEKIDRFGKALVVLVDRQQPADSLLLKKPTNKVAHAGGARIASGSDDEKILAAWVNRLANLSGAELAQALKYREEEAIGQGHAAPKVALRRLTHSQYNNTVRDLLGDQTSPANQFPPEDFVNGFKNQYQAQNLSPLLLESYGAAAEKLARNAFRGGDTRGLVPCKPSVACRTQFVREFGLKAFRRPLELEELQRYEALMRKGTDFYKGAQLAVEAMLQSPHFLFRLEETANPKWESYSTAALLPYRLWAYTLWDTMPDSALLEAATKSQPSTPEAVERVARRMLNHTKWITARHATLSTSLCLNGIRIDRILTASKDRRRYPQFTRETAIVLTEAARVFLGGLA